MIPDPLNVTTTSAPETSKNRIYMYIILFIVVVVVVMGMFFGSVSDLFETSQKPEDSTNTNTSQDTNIVEKLGRVIYTNPDMYPGENISYRLVDADGKDIILLTASDDKLKIIENSTVKVRGRIKKTTQGNFDVLFVEQVVFN